MSRSSNPRNPPSWPSEKPWEVEIQELPNGRLLCPHGLVRCGECCVDYSFMDELSGEESEEESEDEIEDEIEEGDDELLDTEYSRELLAWLTAKASGSCQSFADYQEITRPSRLASVSQQQSPRPQTSAQRDQTVTDDSSIPAYFGSRPVTRGSGHVLAERFMPPGQADKPEELFPRGNGRGIYFERFLHRQRPWEILIYTDGACLNNGQVNAKGGWAFVFKPSTGDDSNTISGLLESKGPFGDECPQTSNRAELRAVIAALRFRVWYGEGFRSVVIATDSEYVVEGATKWVSGWVRKGWRTSLGPPVKNKDLWEALLGEIEHGESHDLTIKFWRIPRQLNTAADAAAKQAAAKVGTIQKFGDIFGIMT